MRHAVFIIEDHPITRQGFVSVIREAPELEVAGEAASIAEALEKVAAARPDLAIVDIGLEGESGIELMKQLRHLIPGLKMLAVSMHDEALYAERALRAGANGYLMKNATSAMLLEAVREVLRGRVSVSERIRERLLERNIWLGMEEPSTPLEQLSDRELEVFRQLGRGLSTQQIADHMEVSPRTVSTYRERIKVKLGLQTASELIQQAVAWVASETR